MTTYANFMAIRLLCIVIALSSSVALAEQIVLEDFESSEVTAFPSGWKVKKLLWYANPHGDEPWRVLSEGGNRYLAAESETDAITVGKEIHYDFSRYKYLSWRWRVLRLPDNGSEGARERSDSAAGVYLVFEDLRAIKYVWSTTLRPGTVVDSPFSGRTKIIVLRSGSDNLNQWITERRNAADDYQRVFNVKNVPQTPKVLALLTDSDSTKSSAIAHYDDIIVSSD
jgi:hypothetical protein